MTNAEICSGALKQLARLESFKFVEANLPPPPSSMPQDPTRAAGVDPELWYGLGIVGVWSALDALRERMRMDQQQFAQALADAHHRQIREELDDLRNLFAHNFAGVVDDDYLSPPNWAKRHHLKRGATYHLACGLRFDGTPAACVALTREHFLYYIDQARNTVQFLSDAQ